LFSTPFEAQCEAFLRLFSGVLRIFCCDLIILKRSSIKEETDA
jgi:hypothetical protein